MRRFPTIRLVRRACGGLVVIHLSEAEVRLTFEKTPGQVVNCCNLLQAGNPPVSRAWTRGRRIANLPHKTRRADRYNLYVALFA